MTSIISSFAFFIGLAIIWYLFASKRNKQRHEEIIALIEKGEYDPALFEHKWKYREEMFLLSAIILIALGVALLIGVPIASKKLDGIIAGLIPFFIGWGLLVFYYILGRIEKSKSVSEK
jgi:purine-cytosine permease-like protein